MDYLNALWVGFTDLLTWQVLLMLMVGVLLGIWSSLLPGVGNVFLFAIILPFTFAMTPIEAIALLVGIFATGGIAGEITSILFAVPGEASAAAAILDGHPLSKQGQAGRAIGADLFSSLVGGLFGALVLAAVIPLVRPFVLALGNAELFMLIVLGIVFIASLSGKRLLPAALVAGLGFSLSMIGPDPITGQLRFTFGRIELYDGIPLISVALGLFAVPELINLSVRKTSIAENPAQVGKDLFQGVQDTIHHWKLVLQASVIGVVIGIIPGLGGSVAQWVAYGWARDRSKNKDMFGKGAIEGVLAPGTATNAKDGGQLIPTIVFGVPGGTTMALLLAAFLIVGVQPGPRMLDQHLTLTFSIVWVVVLSHVIGVGICFLFLRQIIALTKVKATILIPFILAFVILGSFVARGDIMGVWFTLAFGALGYALVRLDWPRPPLMLAFILGPLAENYLWLAQQLYGWAWLTRPIVLGIMVFIVLYLVYIIRQKRTSSMHGSVLDAQRA